MSIEISTRVWKHSAAKGGNLLVLLAIADNADTETGEAFPGVAYLAAKTRLSVRGVKYATKNLIEMGELELVERGGFRQGKATANLYRVKTKVQTLHVKDTKVQFRVEEGAVVAPQPSVEPSVLKERKETDPRTREVFDYWQSTLNRERSKLTPTRRTKIEARLKAGATVEEIKRAIDGCAGSEFHTGQGHVDLTLICRSDEKLEFFQGMPKAEGDEDFFAGTGFS